jgi:hypothetical protein
MYKTKYQRKQTNASQFCEIFQITRPNLSNNSKKHKKKGGGGKAPQKVEISYD